MGASSLLVRCCHFDRINADFYPRSSAIRAEVVLNSMNDCLSKSEHKLLSLDRHLSSIQQVVTQTYHAVSAQGVAMNSLLQSNISSLNFHSNLTEYQSSWPAWYGRGSQYVVPRLFPDHSKESMDTSRNPNHPTEDYENVAERKPRIKSSLDLYSHDHRPNTSTGTLESFRSLTKYFSRIIYHLTAAANIFSRHSQLL